MEFFNHLLILFGLMFGFTCFKVSNTSYFVEGGEAFDFKKL